MNCESYLMTHVLFSLLRLCTGLNPGHWLLELLSENPLHQRKGKEGSRAPDFAQGCLLQAENILNVCFSLNFTGVAILFWSNFLSKIYIYICLQVKLLHFFISTSWSKIDTPEKMNLVYSGILWHFSRSMGTQEW